MCVPEHQIKKATSQSKDRFAVGGALFKNTLAGGSVSSRVSAFFSIFWRNHLEGSPTAWSKSRLTVSSIQPLGVIALMRIKTR